MRRGRNLRESVGAQSFRKKAEGESTAPQLTDRELQIITSLARGNGNKQIARALDISEKTVRNHVSNIYKKLHVYDRTQAVLYAIREGLVDVDGVGNG